MNSRRKIAKAEYFLLAFTAASLIAVFAASRTGLLRGQSGLTVSAERGLQAEEITLPVESKVNINTASAYELETLPGIGAAMAEKIIEDRETRGPFWDKEDLMRVSGIGQSVYAGLEDRIVTDTETGEEQP